MFSLILVTMPEAPLGILESVRRALGGIDGSRVAIQLRAKALPNHELFRIGRELRALTERCGAALLVNEHVQLARDLGADGVHFPDRRIESARDQEAQSGWWLGASCHSEEGLDRALRAGASYATLSPLFESPGKGATLGIERFRACVRHTKLPVFALGGLNAQRASLARRAGASGIAVMSSVLAAEDPAQAAHQLLLAWDSAQ